MALLTRHRFTVEDYYRMAETGVLKPDDRVELLEGEIVDMMPPGPFHAGVTKRLIQLFSGPAKGRWVVAAQDPLHLGRHSEPQPDLMLLRPSPDDYTTAHPTPEDVFLLVEVADTSLNYDRKRKLPAYGRAGVPEVWVVNLTDRTVEVCREPHYTGYGSTVVLEAGEVARPMAFPDVSISVSALLRHAG